MGGPPSFSLLASLELPTITKESVPDGSAWVQLKTEHIRRYGEQIAQQFAGGLNLLPPKAVADTTHNSTKVGNAEEHEGWDDSNDERAGSVVYWNDDRGFGFLKDINTGERIFFHASALDYPGDRTYLADSFGAADFDDEVWYTPKLNNERTGIKAQ